MNLVEEIIKLRVDLADFGLAGLALVMLTLGCGSAQTPLQLSDGTTGWATKCQGGVAGCYQQASELCLDNGYKHYKVIKQELQTPGGAVAVGNLTVTQGRSGVTKLLFRCTNTKPMVFGTSVDGMPLQLSGASVPPYRLSSQETPSDGPAETRKASSAAVVLGGVGLGVGTVGTIVGSGFFVAAGNARSESDALFAACSPACSNSKRQAITELDRTASGRRAVGFGLVIGSGVVLAGGMVALVLGLTSNRSKASRRASVEPWLGPNWVGAQGAF